MKQCRTPKAKALGFLSAVLAPAGGTKKHVYIDANQI